MFKELFGGLGSCADIITDIVGIAPISNKIHYCTICKKNTIDTHNSLNGYDTCKDCLDNT